MMIELVGVFSGRTKRSTGAVPVTVVVALAPLPGRECCQLQQLPQLPPSSQKEEPSCFVSCHVFQDSLGLSFAFCVSPNLFPFVQIDQSLIRHQQCHWGQNVWWAFWGELLQHSFIILSCFLPVPAQKQTTSPQPYKKNRLKSWTFCFSCRNLIIIMEICKHPTYQSILTAQGMCTSKNSCNML